MAPDAMTIPARPTTTASPAPRRPARCSSSSADGALHMRYTARTRSIEWKDDAATRAAVAFLRVAGRRHRPHAARCGWRPAWAWSATTCCTTAPPLSTTRTAPRLLYRARYHDRVAGLTEPHHVAPGHRLARRPAGGRAARRAATARARRRARADRRPGFDRDAAARCTRRPSWRSRACSSASRRSGRGLRPPRARAHAAEPGGAGAAPVPPEPGTGRSAAPPAALPRAGGRAARRDRRAARGGAERPRAARAARQCTPGWRGRWPPKLSTGWM